MPGSAEPGRPPAPDWAGPLVAAGLDAIGVLSVEAYDALVPEGFRAARLLPGARSVVVAGAGGARLAERALARGGVDPVDTWTQDACAAWLETRGKGVALYAWERRNSAGQRAVDGEFADFVGLAEAAGLGTPSRLGLLLSPVFGPWWSVRAVLLTEWALAWPAGAPMVTACDGCEAPCAAACPAGALSAGRIAWSVCAAERRSAAGRRSGDRRGCDCDRLCAARRACVVGREYAYPTEVEAHFMRTSLSIALGSEGESAG